MNKRTMGLLIGAILLIVVAVGVTWMVARNNKPPAANTPAVQSYTRLDINIKDGELSSPAATYLVKPGTLLEFHITTNTFGKISVPTTPPQTITFTKSPLIFHFASATKPGTYPLYYEATGSTTVAQIGTIVVRNK